MSEESCNLGSIGVQQQTIGGAIHVSVALNASLGVEDEVVVSNAFRKGLYRVGNHAVEPAQSVSASDSEAGVIAEIEDCPAIQGRGHFLIICGKSLRREHSGVRTQAEIWTDCP